MANDIICEISSENELICEMSSAGEIVVEITGMTYQSVAAELAGKADKAEIEAARGTEATLGARLDSTDSQLNNIENVQLPAKANKLQSAAITPTILGAAIQSTTSPLTYAVDDFGYVHFQGAVVPSVTTSFTLMRLPVGHRPAQNLEFLGLSGTVAAFRILVRADGYVTIYNHTTQTSYLDAVHFKAV